MGRGRKKLELQSSPRFCKPGFGLVRTRPGPDTPPPPARQGRPESQPGLGGSDEGRGEAGDGHPCLSLSPPPRRLPAGVALRRFQPRGRETSGAAYEPAGETGAQRFVAARAFEGSGGEGGLHRDPPGWSACLREFLRNPLQRGKKTALPWRRRTLFRAICALRFRLNCVPRRPV